MFGIKGLGYWMGYESSFNDALILEAKAASLDQVKVQAQMKAECDDYAANNEEPRLPRLYSRVGNVGVISIKGPLINSDNWMTEYLGMATYPAIQRAAAFAAQDKTVATILLDVGSGGGQVSGVESTAGILRQLGKIKPMTAFSDSLIGSAAYWLAATASKIYCQETTIIGSIGAAIVHTSVAESLKQQGISMTVIRSGEFKMIGHPAEPLSKKAEEHLQAMVNKNAEIFEASVGSDRGMSSAQVAKVAKGQEYLGADAATVGLVDGIRTIDQVFAGMAKKKVDNSAVPNNNRSQQIRGSSMTRTVLTEAQVAAAIAAGADEASVLAENALAIAEAAKTPAEIVADTAAQEAADKAAVDAAAVEAAKIPAVVPPVVVPVTNALQIEMDLVKAQLATANAALITMGVAAATAEAKYANDTAALATLRTIACDSINKMTVALGGTATATESLSADAVAARHLEISAQFAAKFKVGGVAAVAVVAKDAPAAAKPKVSSMDQARVAAANTGGSK